MSQQAVDHLKPFLSVLIIILTLFLIVFVKMEIRRIGYVIWKQSRVEKQMRDRYHQTSAQLAQKMGPGRLHNYAKSELDLQNPHSGQIVQMTYQQVALKQ